MGIAGLGRLDNLGDERGPEHEWLILQGGVKEPDQPEVQLQASPPRSRPVRRELAAGRFAY
jgi:hypothetical protein